MATNQTVSPTYLKFSRTSIYLLSLPLRRVYCIAKHIAELLEFFYCGILSEEAECIIIIIIIIINKILQQ